MDPIPEHDPINNRDGHVVAVWQETTLIWGGVCDNNHGVWNPAIIHCHCDGIWTARKTSGHVPSPTLYAAAEVIADDLYVICGICNHRESNDIYKLNLKTWTWFKLEPKGTRPLKSDSMVSWVSGKKIYIFGGAGEGADKGTWYPGSLELEYSDQIECFFNNQLVYYDCHYNSWNWPTACGRAPSPRTGHAGFHVQGWYKETNSPVKNFRSLAYVFGGSDCRELTCSNELYFLDMLTMKWEVVYPSKDAIRSEKWPTTRSSHSFTVVSPKEAVLFGGSDNKQVMSDCWFLNIEECISKAGVNAIWTRYEHHKYDGWEGHKAILEPSSHRVWILGGYSPWPENTDHIRELTVSAPPLKALALESAAAYFEKLVPEIQDLPQTDALRRAVEAKAARRYVIS